MQNFVAISSLVIELQRYKFAIKFKLWAKIHQYNGPLEQDVAKTYNKAVALLRNFIYLFGLPACLVLVNICNIKIQLVKTPHQCDIFVISS